MHPYCFNSQMARHTVLTMIGILALASSAAMAQSNYQGNKSTGFAGPLGNSTLTISDNPNTSIVTFSLAATAAINNVAFYFSTGSGGVADTTTLTDTADAGRRSITGQGTSAGHTNVTFASGFSAKYALALDNSGNANLFQIVPGNANLTFVSGANATQTGNTYGFSFNETLLGITPGSSFDFVATLTNANSGNNGNDVFRSNETIGVSNSDNNATGNLGNTGTLTYTGFDTYVTTVPEPATWLAGMLTLSTAAYSMRRRLRLLVA